MKLKDFTKEGNPEFELRNPKVTQDETGYYTIEYDAIYDDGHVEQHIGFGSYNYRIIEEDLRYYFGIDKSFIAKWITHKSFFHRYGECSNCHNYIDFNGVNGGRGDANYCPNCGARMREK